MNTAIYISMTERQALKAALRAWRFRMLPRYGLILAMGAAPRHQRLIEAL